MIPFSVENIEQRLQRMPTLTIVLSLIVGIIVSASVSMNWVGWLVVFCVALICALPIRRTIYLAIFAYGGQSYSYHTAQRLPCNEPLQVVVEMDYKVADYGSHTAWSADVHRCNGEACRAKILLSVDSLVVVDQGDVVEAAITLRSIDGTKSGYSHFTLLRGYSGRGWLSERKVESIDVRAATTLHSRAVKRIGRLLGTDDTSAVAMSVLLGAKQHSLAPIRKAYSYSGMSHLLAVSGLHIGMVLLLLLVVLRPIVFLPRGNRMIYAVAVVLMWAYVAVCGYPASAVRAALMLTLLNLSSFFELKHSNSNSVCLAALIMLAADPTLLFDVGFILSFVAVIAIINFALPLCRMMAIKQWWLRLLINSMVISTVCVVATLPIVSICFGTISVLSILVTPLALIFAQLTLIYGLMMLVTPDVVAQSFVAPLRWCSDMGNAIIEGVVQWGVGFGSLSFSAVGVAVYYAVLVAVMVLFWGVKGKKRFEITNND